MINNKLNIYYPFEKLGFKQMEVPSGKPSAKMHKKGFFQIEYSTGCWWVDLDGMGIKYKRQSGITSLKDLKWKYYRYTGEQL